MQMQKKYVPTGNWVDKESGQPKSRLCELNEGTNKKGDAYQFVDTDHSITVDGTYPVGKILAFAMTPITAEKPKPDVDFKINKSNT